jgi:hypothetical protein
MNPDTFPASDRAEWARATADQLYPEPEMTRAEAERDAAELGDWRIGTGIDLTALDERPAVQR